LAVIAKGFNTRELLAESSITIKMKKLIFATCIAMLLAATVRAQNTTLEFQPGKLAVLTGGNGVFTFADRRWPVYINEFDPVVSNSVPLLSVPIPTNGPDCMFFNLHGGSEGVFISRAYNRQYLVVAGYHTNQGGMGPLTSTPSSAGDVDRGFETWDAFTNIVFEYDNQNWFGLGANITQDNPRGIATDGTNSYWGDGTVATTGSGSLVESGTLCVSFGDTRAGPEFVRLGLRHEDRRRGFVLRSEKGEWRRGGKWYL
jgi:hypothetical protein